MELNGQKVSSAYCRNRCKGRPDCDEFIDDVKSYSVPPRRAGFQMNAAVLLSDLLYTKNRRDSGIFKNSTLLPSYISIAAMLYSIQQNRLRNSSMPW